MSGLIERQEWALRALGWDGEADTFTAWLYDGETEEQATYRRGDNGEWVAERESTAVKPVRD